MTQDVIQRRWQRLVSDYNRRAAFLGTQGRLTVNDLYDIFSRSWSSDLDAYVCTYCDVEIDPMHCSFDHVLSFTQGGPNDTTNVVASCITCQRSKFLKSPAEYAIWREMRNTCPVDGTVFQPRWADHVRGFGKYCSRRCTGVVGGKAYP
jgi:5-methylcytosine-specific restriction endonuclease McrA